MTLDDETAQELLDKAILDEWKTEKRNMNSISEYKERKLYAKKNGKYYEFQGANCEYHGYEISIKELEDKCSTRLLHELNNQFS